MGIENEEYKSGNGYAMWEVSEEILHTPPFPYISHYAKLLEENRLMRIDGNVPEETTEEDTEEMLNEQV